MKASSNGRRSNADTPPSRAVGVGLVVMTIVLALTLSGHHARSANVTGPEAIQAEAALPPAQGEFDLRMRMLPDELPPDF